MSYLLYVALCVFLVGVMAVASNPSPFFAALGLVAVALAGCWVVVSHGGTFLSVIVMLIYLGGMLVVFAYACSFSAEQYPEGWESDGSKALIVFYGLLLTVAGLLLLVEHGELSWVVLEQAGSISVCRGDFVGVSFLYQGGGMLLGVAAWGLVLTLFVVMEISRGGSRGVLRV